jgi:hypothetical protein
VTGDPPDRAGRLKELGVCRQANRCDELWQTSANILSRRAPYCPGELPPNAAFDLGTGCD